MVIRTSARLRVLYCLLKLQMFEDTFLAQYADIELGWMIGRV